MRFTRPSRGIPPPKGIYVIMLTAQGREVDWVRGMEAGADEYLTKPCRSV